MKSVDIKEPEQLVPGGRAGVSVLAAHPGSTRLYLLPHPGADLGSTKDKF